MLPYYSRDRTLLLKASSELSYLGEFKVVISQKQVVKKNRCKFTIGNS